MSVRLDGLCEKPRRVDRGRPHSGYNGDNDSSATYQRTNAIGARMLLANCEDTANTNITITAREIAPDLPLTAIVEEEDSVDILLLSGATTVLPLKHQLGEYLANRVDTGGGDAHVIGAYHGLQIAELPARDTVFAGQTVRDTRLRETTGVSVIGLWERGRLRPAFPDSLIRPDASSWSPAARRRSRRSTP